MANRPPKTVGLRDGKQSKIVEKTGRKPIHIKQNTEVQTIHSAVPRELQQRCLDVFRIAFAQSTEDTEVLQQVKGYLYARDFAAAFSREEYLQVYAARWSPSRALAYLQVLNDLHTHVLSATRQAKESNCNECLRVVALGGGAGGELVALGAWLSELHTSGQQRLPGNVASVELDILDIAGWENVVLELRRGILSPPPVSKYASQEKKDAARALLPEGCFTVRFRQQDVLSSDRDSLSTTVATANIVTLMFTLNELYSASISETQSFLEWLKTAMLPNALLVVVDSPGSYSTVSLNGAEKKYPMHWLLDYLLLGKSGTRNEDVPLHLRWEKVVSDESRWFRVPSELSYPITLENMRYQIHVFRKRAPG